MLRAILYNIGMSNKKYLRNEKPYRPAFGKPYQRVLLLLAEEINKSAMETFDDLDAGRLAVYELWKRVFPDKPFPKDADVLRRRFDLDPEIKIKTVQSA